MDHRLCARLGKRIRALRKAKRWRQIDLAQHCSLHEGYISHLERGEKEPCLLALSAIAHALGLTLSELLKDVD